MEGDVSEEPHSEAPGADHPEGPHRELRLPRGFDRLGGSPEMSLWQKGKKGITGITKWLVSVWCTFQINSKRDPYVEAPHGSPLLRDVLKGKRAV